MKNLVFMKQNNKIKEISIIVPVYNSVSYLPMCLDSVLSQDFSNFELIIVDDGSTDGSGELCDFYSKKDKRIIVIHKKNGGVSSARNCGLKLSTGKYVCFIDSDDSIGRGFLKHAYEVSIKNRVDIYMSGIYLKKENDDIISCAIENNIFIENGIINKEYKKELLSRNYLSEPVAKLYNLKAIGSMMFDENMSYGEDLDFNLRFFRKIKRVYADSKCFYFYRMNPNSITHNVSINKCSDVSKVAILLINDCHYNYGDSAVDYREYIGRRFVSDYFYHIDMIYKQKASLGDKYIMIKAMINDKRLKNDLEKYSTRSLYYKYPCFVVFSFVVKRFIGW